MMDRGGHRNRISKEQRQRIINLFLEHGKEVATGEAIRLGLDEKYAIRLARELGLVPRTRPGTHPKYELEVS